MLQRYRDSSYAHKFESFSSLTYFSKPDMYAFEINRTQTLAYDFKRDEIWAGSNNGLIVITDKTLFALLNIMAKYLELLTLNLLLMRRGWQLRKMAFLCLKIKNSSMPS